MRRAAGSAAALAVGFLAARAEAHEVGLSRGEYVVEGASLRVEIVFARKEVIGLVAGLDADHDGALTPAELSAGRASIEGALVGRLRVKGDGAPCPGTIDRADLAEQDGVSVHAVYRCPRRPKKLTVDLAFLDDLAFGHRHLGRASAGSVVIDQVLSQRSPSLSIDVPVHDGGSAGSADYDAPRASGDGGPSPLRRGARHVLSHPAGAAFLLALFTTCGGRRAALLAAAAFTGAAALGLGLGARGVFVPDPRALTAAIALSVVYAGLEAMGAPDGTARWRVALPFGVVHGLWCAAGYQASGEGGIGAFGAGAALALVAVVAALLWARAWAERRRLLAGRRVAALGAAIAAAGAVGLLTGRL
jgi:hypothetical protein